MPVDFRSKIQEFDELTISKLFGHEAAEDEDASRLIEYYFKSDSYEQVTTNLPLRILVGHKGIGKSALFKVAMQEDKNNNRIMALIKPDDIIGLGSSSKEFLQIIREWKDGLSEIISKKILQSTGSFTDGNIGKLRSYGGAVVDFLSDTFRDKLKEYDLMPSKQILINNYLKDKSINIYIDDLDRGWQGRKEDIIRISALLNAVRDMASENPGLNFKISLRADVYYLVRTSDESTDKIEGSVIWQTWTNQEILVMLIKRIETFFGRQIDENALKKTPQDKLSWYLNPIFHPFFRGEGRALEKCPYI